MVFEYVVIPSTKTNFLRPSGKETAIIWWQKPRFVAAKAQLIAFDTVSLLGIPPFFSRCFGFSCLVTSRICLYVIPLSRFPLKFSRLPAVVMF